MTFLYDTNNNLVPADQWPAELADVKKHVGNGYCCVSENKPSKENEPPADCVKAVFGTDIKANFIGLKDSAESPIGLGDVPTGTRHVWGSDIQGRNHLLEPLHIREIIHEHQ
jgi:hypothetical protein